MEEILASIRRILNEDEAPAAVAEVPPDEPIVHHPQVHDPVAQELPPHEPAAEEEDVLVLDRTMLVSTDEAGHAPPQLFHPDSVVAETERSPPDKAETDPLADEVGAATDPVPEPPIQVMTLSQPLELPSSAAEFQAHSEPAQAGPPQFDGNSLVAPETAAATASSVGGLLRTLSANRAAQVYRGGPTIEDVVRDELRPMLKGWLDEHLPPLVERLVRSEIEKLVARAVS